MALNPQSKKGKDPSPHALALFKTLDDVQHLEHIYRLHFQAEDRREFPVLKICGQKLMIQRPNPDYIRRATSSRGHSEAESQPGSEHSHSSVSQSEYKNLTLLFSNIPESLCTSFSQRPASKQAIEEYVKKVLLSHPPIGVSPDAISYSASFSEPRKAPYCSCWLNFKYTVEGKRISADDGKAYSLSAFKALYKDKKSDAVIMKMWARSSDAVFELEKMIGNGKPMSVARWFMDRVKATRAEAPTGKDKNKIWTQFQLGGHPLSVEFKRPEKSS